MPTSQIAKTGKPILDGRKAKLRPYRQDQVRAQIQVSKLINVVQDHALGISDEISASRIHAAKLLIDKVLPNAIPESIEQNNQAQALQAISQAQLALMAQEMIRNNGLQGNTINQIEEDKSLKIESTTTGIDSVPESIPLDIPSFVVNKQQNEDVVEND